MKNILKINFTTIYLDFRQMLGIFEMKFSKKKIIKLFSSIFLYFLEIFLIVLDF